MWYTLITILHIIVCFFLATVVLLQQGKGSDVSAVFGGSSQTLFGSSGAGNLLTKLTSASAIVFMLTSLTLTYGAARQSTKSLFDNTPVKTLPPVTAPENPPTAPSAAPATPQSALPPATPGTDTPSASTKTAEQPAAATAGAVVPAVSASPPNAGTETQGQQGQASSAAAQATPPSANTTFGEQKAVSAAPAQPAAAAAQHQDSHPAAKSKTKKK